jgi:hypothetical protein
MSYRYTPPFEPGDTVVFKGQSEEQRRWGGHTDASDLTVGRHYVVDHLEVHSWHTRVFLKNVPGRYNSVCFGLASPHDSL